MGKAMFLAIVLISFLGGCSSVATMREADPTEGASKTYSADVQRVVDAVRQAITDAGFPCRRRWLVNRCK